MTASQWTIIMALATGAYVIRLAGMFIGDALIAHPRLRNFIDVLPGCLIVALIGSSLAGQPNHIWIAALAALLVAACTNNLLATMLAGFGFVAFLANWPFGGI